jgi:hypothetical protein
LIGRSAEGGEANRGGASEFLIAVIAVTTVSGASEFLIAVIAVIAVTTVSPRTVRGSCATARGPAAEARRTRVVFIV